MTAALSCHWPSRKNSPHKPTSATSRTRTKWDTSGSRRTKYVTDSPLTRSPLSGQRPDIWVIDSVQGEAAGLISDARMGLSAWSDDGAPGPLVENGVVTRRDLDARRQLEGVLDCSDIDGLLKPAVPAALAEDEASVEGNVSELNEPIHDRHEVAVGGVGIRGGAVDGNFHGAARFFMIVDTTGLP